MVASEASVASEATERGKRAFAGQQWKEAFDQLALADSESHLGPAELEQLGDAAYLVGRDDDAIAAWTRAHHAFVELADVPRAARLGFWLSLSLLLRGKAAQSSGWLARTQRLIGARDCPERGLALVISGLFSMGKGDAQKACSCFEEGMSLAERFEHADLMAVSLLGWGQALAQMRRVDEGVVRLDEAMLAVTTGKVSPLMAGIVYCGVIVTCERVSDLPRAHEWTEALDTWCGSQPELVAFRGECLVQRGEVMRFKGDWSGALDEARRASELLSSRSARLASRALYQQAELHRLRGEYRQAEALYREAGAGGFEPQPGVSLLRLAQGDVEAAKASIRRVEREAGNQQGPGSGTQRIAVLGPLVEIMLAAGELEPARAAAEELGQIAADVDALLVKAIAAHASGAVFLASEDAERALSALREAWATWQRLQAPYESARVRVLMGHACALVGDRDTATMHYDAATAVFERLGATPDLAGLRAPERTGTPSAVKLSRRERQVLSLVASGSTNRQIAADLGISEHTVARHVSNIFNKIGVGTRAAATAFAFENDLV